MRLVAHGQVRWLVRLSQTIGTCPYDSLEHRLPEEVEQKIRDIVSEDADLQQLHHLRTRQVGNVYSINMHLRMPGDTTLNNAHYHSWKLEQRLRAAFGENTIINIHIEPFKINGEYIHD